MTTPDTTGSDAIDTAFQNMQDAVNDAFNDAINEVNTLLEQLDNNAPVTPEAINVTLPDHIG